MRGVEGTGERSGTLSLALTQVLHITSYLTAIKHLSNHVLSSRKGSTSLTPSTSNVMNTASTSLESDVGRERSEGEKPP